MNFDKINNVAYWCVYICVFILCVAFIASLGRTIYRAVKPAQPTITVWQYKSHDMLRYTVNGETSVCHSPECRKCIQVYDDNS